MKQKEALHQLDNILEELYTYINKDEVDKYYKPAIDIAKKAIMKSKGMTK